MNHSPTAPTAPATLAPPPPSDELQGVEYVPSPSDVLAVAWIGAHFEAAATRKGAVVSQTIALPDCHSSDAFEAHLDAALATLAFKGAAAELLVDGGLLDSTHISLPPVSSRQQQAFVREKAKRLQSGDAPLVWESQRIAATKTGPRVLLHSIDKTAFNVLDEQFARRGLALKKVLPFLGAATRPFKDIQTPPDSASIVLAPVGHSYKIIAIDNAGDLQFARDLNKENGTDPQRVAVEINRCLLFARQQFGKPVSQIVTVGLQAARFKSVIKIILQGEIPIIHRSLGKQLWLSQLATSNAFNLAKESMLQDRKLRFRKLLASAACLAAGAAMLAFAADAESTRRATEARYERLAADETSMLAAIEQAESLHVEAEALRNFLADPQLRVRPPVERAVLNFLADALPADTWTTEIEIAWSPALSAWNVRLLLVCEADSSVAERRKANLQKALREAPFAMSFPANALDRVRKISARGGSETNRETISIEGLIALADAPHAP